MQMTFGGQSGNALAGAPPFLCVRSLSRVIFLPLLGKFWGREGRQSSLTLKECMEREIVVVSQILLQKRAEVWNSSWAASSGGGG